MKAGFRELDESANVALTRFFDRTGWNPVDTKMPFHQMMEAEEDGEDGEIGEYEIRQRMIGVMAFFRFLKSRGIHPANMLNQLIAAGRACHVPPFNALTMQEASQLVLETPAAHSWRCKILSGEIKLSGQRGTKLPGQKSEDASQSYQVVRKGNTNRKGGKPPATKKIKKS